jgi:hypothetical protein
MKIRLGTLRKIISEEISRSLTEGPELNLGWIKNPTYSSWLKVVKKNPMEATKVWDKMVAASPVSSALIRTTAEELARGTTLDVGAVSYHLRALAFLVKDGRPIPSGEDFKDEVAAASARAAAMPKSPASPPREFDPYANSPQLVGSSGRYVGD